MSNRFPPVMVVMLVVGVAAAVALAQRAPDPVTADLALSADMAESARRFLSSLPPAQRARAVFAVASDERQRWHYVPQPRPGIAFKELNDAQRALAYGSHFRLAGPSFIYEFDNTQASANHVHTVWHARDPAGGDFGIDLLRQHLTQSHAPAPTASDKKD